MPNLFLPVLLWCGNHKTNLIRLFYWVAAFYFAVVALGAYLILSHSHLVLFSAMLGLNSGKFAIIAFFATTYPGILGRFGFKHPLITLGMMFRRESGISSFFLALGHALLLFIIPKIVDQTSILDFPLFTGFGMAAFLILFVLYTTSNDYMLQRLGKWWKPLHRLVYIVYWLIFLHVIYQKTSLISLAVGVSALLEILSLCFDFIKKSQAKTA